MTKQEMESFVGFMNYHREFCKNFVEIMDSLYKLAASVPKSNSRIDLSEEHIGAIEYLRTQLLQAPVLPYPDVESTFILDCDASNVAIGCELSQMGNGKETPIPFGSYILVPPQCKYCTTRKELYLLWDSHGCSVIIYLENDYFCIQIIIVFGGYSASVMSKANCRDV